MLQPVEFLLYLRKSRGRAGISRQRRETTAHIEAGGGRVVAEFVDVDTTAYAKPGQRARRDDYARMLSVLRADSRPVPLGIAAWHTDRLNRSTTDADELIVVASEGGHIVETARAGSYDLSTATGRKRFRQDAVDAAFEVDHMTERITSAKLEAAAAGEYFGGRRAFGYRKDGTRHKRREAAAVDSGADAILSGVPLSQVVRDWNAAGLTGTGGGAWSITTARRVLLNPRNAGLMVHRGQVIGRAKWLPILAAGQHRPPKGAKLTPEAEEAWRADAEAKYAAVAAVLTDPARRTSPGPERRWLGSGIYRCGLPGDDGAACGLPVKVGSAKGPRRRTVYRCSGESRHVVRDTVILDAYVAQVLCARLARPDAAELLRGEADVDAARLLAEKAALRGRLDELAEMFTAGDIDGPQLRRGTAKLKDQITELDERLAAKATTNVLDGIAGQPDAAQIWKGLDLHRRRAILAATMEVTILPAPRGKPRGHVPGQPYFHPDAIRIEWVRPG